MPESITHSFPDCTGAHDCTAPVHEHGCFNDYGACNDPAEHDPANWGLEPNRA